MTLLTSPNAIMRWLGIVPIRTSDNLRLPDPRKARMARVLWEHYGGLDQRADGPAGEDEPDGAA